MSILPELILPSIESVPSEITKARDDAIQLHHAFEGSGCDVVRIIQTVVPRNATQRALMRKVYKTMFSEDLHERLSSKLSGDVKYAVLLWMLDPARRDATIVRQAMKESLEVLIEVICSRTPSQIEQLKMIYHPMFGASLEQDIENHASDDIKKLLLAYVGTQRSEGQEVDEIVVDEDAKAISAEGQWASCTTENSFMRIFSERSCAHLVAVSFAYRSLYGTTLEKAVEEKTSLNFKCALLTILGCAENPVKYFAEVLNKAMKAHGTDEKTLIRIIVSRAEIDIPKIKAEYLTKYGKRLIDPLDYLKKYGKPLSDPPEIIQARDDAILLHRAMKGRGCDAPRIVQILAHRNATQRALIKEEYKTVFSEDLEKRLSSELTGDLKQAVLLWMLAPARRDATIVRLSLRKLINKLEVPIEVICSRTPSQIQELKMAYGLMFDASLEQDIEDHSSGDIKKLMLACLRTQRSEGQEVDANMVDEDAKALYKCGQSALGTNWDTYISIFSERSWAHLAAVSSAYRSMYVDSLQKAVKNETSRAFKRKEKPGAFEREETSWPFKRALLTILQCAENAGKYFAEAVKKETSWDFKRALLTILQCAENPGKYFAKVLYRAMKGLGTDEETLTRIIVSRAEVDIQQIKAEYHKKYGKSLIDVVHSETSNEYRTFLRSLLDPIIK